MKNSFYLFTLFFVLLTLVFVLTKKGIEKYDTLKESKIPFIIVYANVEHVSVRDKYNIPKSMSDVCIDSVWAIKTRLGIPEHIPFNLIMKESCFDSNSLSPDGCFGYMQLNPKYFKPCNSNENIRQRLTFLKEQYDRLGSWEKAVIYYNSGNKIKSDPEFVRYILNHK